jgi:hypothetical protein
MRDEQHDRADDHLMSRDEMRLYASMQLQEIDKYKWCLGERLGHDPLQDRELNAIAKEWIDNYAAGFRNEYESRQRLRKPNGNQGSSLSPAA